jgi:hypothetical protein
MIHPSSIDQARCPAEPRSAQSGRRRRLAGMKRASWSGFAGRAAIVVLFCLCVASPVPAQGPPVHYWHQGSMPPGAIGSVQLQRGGPLPGFFQPVKIKAPSGVLISLAEEGRFAKPQPAPATVGLLVGAVYRLRVIRIPGNPGLEVFPTIEVIDRLYTPPGQKQRFPIVVQCTPEDLRLALEGGFITRVIYLEDPQSALPAPETTEGQSWFDVGPGRDPLAVADQLGRPVAILRVGGRLPDDAQGVKLDFLFGCPPVLRYEGPDEQQSAPPEPSAPEAVEAALRSRRTS